MMTRRPIRRRGFTLLELLMVLVIILVLVAIIVPTVSRVRRSAQTASTGAQIAALDAAIRAYNQDFTAYPGPLPREFLAAPDPPSPSAPAAGQMVYFTDGTPLLISGPENLVLGLLGGLRFPRTISPGPGFEFDPGLIGGGPRSLNASNPKAYRAYVEGMNLSVSKAPNWYEDGAGRAFDTMIPEFVDRFPDPMPILYMRARPGANGVISTNGNDAGGPVLAGTPTPPTQYDLNEILPYTKYYANVGSIGEGKRIKASDYTSTPPPNVYPHGLQFINRNQTLDKGAGANYSYPYDAFPYFQNRAIPPTSPTYSGPGTGPNATGTPRNKDGFILISAGADRVYGTADDITNFGNVLE